MGATKRVVSRALIDETSPETQFEQGLPERSELFPGSPLFPRQLLQLQDVPSRLYVLGSVENLNTPAIAIVGARKATTYGLMCAERFARKAAAWGVTVVSGGAIGCDMAAHRGALDAGGRTVVVLGSGADVVYPLRARSLFKEVLAAEGTLLSEAPWGSAPLAWAFSRRNRIIAALGSATLIVEAGLPSGTFQTADHTLALGNEVLVVPGPIFSKESKGSNRLLTQGAIPVVDDESFEDILMQLFGPAHTSYTLFSDPVEEVPAGRTGLAGEVPLEHAGLAGEVPNERATQAGETKPHLEPHEILLRQLTLHILRDLSANPMTIDALAAARGKEAMEIVRVITKLEISGEVVRLRDGRYMAVPRV